MKDDRGVFYYPFPDNRRVRMYVRTSESAVEFRLWSADDPDLWVQHGWVPFEAIQQASKLYEGRQFDPVKAYDIEIARAVLREGG